MGNLFLGIFNLKGSISMQHTDLKEKQVSTALFQFIFPITWKASSSQELVNYLQTHDFAPFQLNDFNKETAYYGRYNVNHNELEAFFLPITNTILFPKDTQPKGLHRYSKNLNLHASMNVLNAPIPFQIHSVDVFICPYELGFITIRAEINHLPFSQVLEFANYFRFLDSTPTVKQTTEISFNEKTYSTVGDFVFSTLVPPLQKFLCKEAVSLLTPNKMYVHSFVSYQEEEVRVPMTFDELSFSIFSNDKQIENNQLISQYYGPYYYSVIINLFHQLVFLKIAKTYSEINIDEATNEFERLNYIINSFTSNYYFNIFPAQTLGHELFKQLRNSFQIDHLYTNTKETLFSLFKYEENIITKRDSLLLLVLTLYTVVCGIFSMNLFTHDLKGTIHWDHFKSYNPFEYFTVFIVFSGIITVFFLGLQSLYQGLQKRRSRQRWVRESVLINKKDKLY